MEVAKYYIGKVQRTIAKTIEFQGAGLHTGKSCHVKVEPAEANYGIQFFKRNGSLSAAIPLSWKNVSQTDYATTLGTNGVRFVTIEHLVSALYGLGVDNARVEIAGGEVPILDGSAEPFVHAILDAGFEQLPNPRRVLRVLRPVSATLDGRQASAYPYDGFKIEYRIDFESALVRNQSYEIEVSPARYVNEIAAARTFCMRAEVDRMWKLGLARGGSLANAIVFENGNVLNPEGLRFKDEPVRHKVLDAVGDLALSGCSVKGAFVADRSGHTLNLKLLQALFSSEENFAIEEL